MRGEYLITVSQESSHYRRNVHLYDPFAPAEISPIAIHLHYLVPIYIFASRTPSVFELALECARMHTVCVRARVHLSVSACVSVCKRVSKNRVHGSSFARARPRTTKKTGRVLQSVFARTKRARAVHVAHTPYRNRFCACSP